MLDCFQLLQGIPVVLFRVFAEHRMLLHLGPFTVQIARFHPIVPFGSAHILRNYCLPVHIRMDAIHFKGSIISALLIQISYCKWEATERTNFGCLVTNNPLEYVIVRMFVQLPFFGAVFRCLFQLLFESFGILMNYFIHKIVPIFVLRQGQGFLHRGFELSSEVSFVFHQQIRNQIVFQRLQFSNLHINGFVAYEHSLRVLVNGVKSC